ncbi:MAG: hypothetical protein GTO02_15315, partial [Candidatus Dadabacteria bacterium]|nr:hypothetical protein [Candidatus Dadabacteria bacterium]
MIYNDNKLKPTVVSMSSNYWTKTRYNKVSYHIIDIIYKLNKMGFIFLKRGFQNNIERKRTRIWATEKLTSITSDLKTKVIYEPVELIELKDNYGNLIDYIDTYKTRRIRSILQKINSLNNRCDITLRNKNLSTSLVAIFKNNFNLYGRLHTRTKNHYQGIPKKERAKIKINGESVIELDFVGLHPHLLYAQENIQLGWDPYSIVIDDPFLRDFL